MRKILKKKFIFTAVIFIISLMGILTVYAQAIIMIRASLKIGYKARK